MQTQPPIKAGALFLHHGSTYRVDAYLCEKPEPVPAEPCTVLERILADIRAEQSAAVAPGMRRIKLYWCSAEEATYVAGSGVSGCVAKIEDIQVIGLVGWDEEKLAEHQANADEMGRQGSYAVHIVRPIDASPEHDK